jgi:hypothetical protein
MIIYNRTVHEDKYRRSNAHKYYVIGSCYRAVPLHSQEKQLAEQAWRFEGIEAIVSAAHEDHALAQFFEAQPDYGRTWRNDPDKCQRVVAVVPLKLLHHWQPKQSETYTRQIEGRNIELLDVPSFG